jgi:hypothetical protein
LRPSPPAPAPASRPSTAGGPDKGAVVLDAYLALVGGQRGPGLPRQRRPGGRPAPGPGIHGGLPGRPVLERRHRALLTAIQDDPALAATLLDRLLKPWLAATTQRLRAAQRAGQLRNDVDLEVAAELVYGPVYYRWLLRTGPTSRQYVDAVVAMTLRAHLTGDGGTRRRLAADSPGPNFVALSGHTL